MWKPVFPSMAALLLLSVSLASGQGTRSGTDQEEPQSQARSVAPARTAQPTHAVALVIGNAAYPDTELKLTHPINDARALADTLRDRASMS